MTAPSPEFNPENLATIAAILDHHDVADTDFAVLRHEASRHNPARPLILVIHPGDLIEGPGGWGPEYQKVLKFSLENQDGTADDLHTWLTAGADICVLHRGSCSQFSDAPNSYVREELANRLYESWTKGTALFGDDLDAALEWMIQNLHIANRPHVYLAGAYATIDNGCLTFIGKAVEKLIGADKITVSDSAPAGNCKAKCWRPGQKKSSRKTHIVT